MKKALIISGGDYSPLPEEIEYDIIIACDKGYSYAERMGLTPDLVLGDFDSLINPEIDKSIPVLTFPVEKDDTDTMLAVKYALEHDYKDITLTCALGRRMDHTLANIQTLHYVASKGGKCRLIASGENMQTHLPGSIKLARKPQSSLSLFALTQVCKGLTIKGAKYDVDSVDLTNSFPLGVSNSWKENLVTISLEEGILLIVESDLSKE